MNNPITYILSHRMRVAIVIVASIFGIWGLTRLWDYFVVQQVVTLQGSLGETVIFGRVIDSETGIDVELGRSTTEPKTIRVHPGNYRAILDSGDDYVKKELSVRVSAATTISTEPLDYSETKLKQLLATETKALSGAIPASLNGTTYSLFAPQLYLDGTWYAAKLLPTDHTLDTLRIIAKKEGDSWKVVAGPEIIIPVREHKDVPESIIRNINNR